MPDGAVRVLIGDVAGRGPEEAALGVCLRMAWRTLNLAGTPFADVLGILQQALHAERRGDEVFATVCHAEIGADRAALTLQLAGHPPPLLLQTAAGVATAAPAPGPPPGPPLGAIPDPTWPAGTAPLPPAWDLLFFTDGLVEGRSGADRLGIEGLTALVEARGDDLGNLVAGAEEAHGGPLEDDVALLLVGFGG
jgi:serine phosphatase RsbU (regulator of sigma subunit)